LALGALVVTTTDASAMLKDPDGSSGASASTSDWPDERSGYPGSGATSPDYNYSNYDPAYKVPAVPTTTAQNASRGHDFEGLRLGASALGGAGVAFGSLWLYRRRQLAAG
jgi:hypothetical protein